MANELGTAIENAETELAKETPVEETPGEETLVEETKTETSKEEKVTPPDTTEQEMALSLFRALKDPTKAADVIRVMAREAGLLETPTEKKEAAKTIEEVIKEGLGEEYDFLADKLAPVIKAAVELSTKDLRESTEAAAQEREAAKIDAAINSVMGKYAGADKLENAVFKLMDDILPAPNQKVEVYIERLLKIASSEQGVPLKLKTAGEKIAANRGNAAARLAAEGGKSETAVVTPAKAMNINEAVAAAMAALKETS